MTRPDQGQPRWRTAPDCPRWLQRCRRSVAARGCRMAPRPPSSPAPCCRPPKEAPTPASEPRPQVGTLQARPSATARSPASATGRLRMRCRSGARALAPASPPAHSCRASPPAHSCRPSPPAHRCRPGRSHNPRRCAGASGAAKQQRPSAKAAALPPFFQCVQYKNMHKS